VGRVGGDVEAGRGLAGLVEVDQGEGAARVEQLADVEVPVRGDGGPDGGSGVPQGVEQAGGAAGQRGRHGRHERGRARRRRELALRRGGGQVVGGGGVQGAQQ